MTVTHEIVPFNHQNRLGEGLLKIDDGSYVNMSDYYNQIGKHLESDTEKVFRALDEMEQTRG